MLGYPALKQLLPAARGCGLLEQSRLAFSRAASSSLQGSSAGQLPRDAQGATSSDERPAQPKQQLGPPTWESTVCGVFDLRPSVLSPLHSVHRRNEEVAIRQQLVQDRLQAESLLNQLPLHVTADDNDDKKRDADVLNALAQRSTKFTTLMQTYKALAGAASLPKLTSADHMYAYYSLLSKQAHRSDVDATGSHLVNSGQADVWALWASEFQQRYEGVPSLEPVEAIYNKDNIDAELARLRAQAKSLVRKSMQEPRQVSSRPADGWYDAVGKRKTSVASVRLAEGQGRLVVNGRPYDQYFADVTCRAHLLKPLLLTGGAGRYNVVVSVGGGGPSGQAQAAAHGISKALSRCNPEAAKELGAAGLLGRDPRMVERKKPGLKKARKAFAWVKR